MSIEGFLLYFVMPGLSLSALVTFIRIFIGPRVEDRIIALDLLITTGSAIIATYSILNNNSTFLDVAMIFALIAFLGTVAFAYYIRKAKDK